MTSLAINTLVRNVRARAELRHALWWLATRVIEWHARRATATILGSLSPRDLRDIGLIPDDVTRAHGLPLSRNAAEALHRAAFGRSGNW